jgi:ACDE family multidrug resistance protein
MSTQNQSFSYGRFLTLISIGLLSAFSGAMINPIIPVIQNTYSNVPNSATLAQLVSSTSAWIVPFMAPLAGYLIDRYRRKPILLLGIITYGVGTSIAFFLDSIYLILLTRVFDGIAAGMFMVAVPTLIADYYSGQRRESAMGYFTAVSSAGGIVASLLAGYITTTLGWRYIFLVYAGALLFVPLIIRFITEPEVTRETDDEEVGRVEAAVNIIRNNPAWLLISIYMIVLLGMLTTNLIQIELPFYLTEALGVSTTRVAFTLSSVYAVAFIMSLLYGRIKQLLPHIAIMAISFTIASAGFIVITLFESYWPVYFGALGSAVGFGLILPTANSWIASVVDPEYHGRALSGVTMFMYVGFALSPFAPDPIISAVGRIGMFLVVGIFLAVIAAVLYGAWFVNRARSNPGTALPSD